MVVVKKKRTRIGVSLQISRYWYHVSMRISIYRLILTTLRAYIYNVNPIPWNMHAGKRHTISDP